MATTGSDNFNRANGGLGANWEASDGFSGGAQIYSNAVGQPGAGAYGNTFLNDQFSQATVAAQPANGDKWAVAVRVMPHISGGNLNSYMGGQDGIGARPYKIFRWVNGVETLLATSGQTVTLNDVVRLEVRGNMLTLFVNGVPILTARDNKFASGNPGIALDIGTATTGYLDDWSGGDLPGIQVSSRSDTLSNASPSATSNHTVTFTTNTNITGASTITLTFPSTFSIPSTLDCGDIDVATSSQFNFNYPGCNGTTTAWGFSVTGTTIMLSAPNDTAVHVATGTPLTIYIGSNATTTQQGAHWITNPSAAGIYTITVGGSFLGSGNILVSINSGVTVAATVAESLALSVSSISAIGCTADDGASINSVSTTGVAVPFGTLNANTFYQGCHDIQVSTNAGNGYSVTVQESHAMMTANGQFTIPDTTCDGGTCSESAAAAWTTATHNGLGHTCFNQLNHDCNAAYSSGTLFRQAADLSQGETAQAVMSSSTPATATGRLKFRLSAPSNQAVGTYTNLITYIITGTY